MAKGLKKGDRVTVSELLSFTRSSEAYKQGLQSVNPGQVGRVVGPGKGRSMIVEFNNVQAAIASQRLQTVKDQAQPEPQGSRETEGEKAGQEKATSAGAAKHTLSPKAATGNYDRRWVTTLANTLLATGTTKPDKEAVVEIRLGDLPEDLQHRIQALVQAKLALGLEAEEQPPVAQTQKASKPGTAQKRGRKPKKAK